LAELSEVEHSKVAEQCATVLCRIARDRGDDGYEFYLEIKSGDPANGLWQVAVTRIDHQVLH
jgi:hypothetical protein